MPFLHSADVIHISCESTPLKSGCSTESLTVGAVQDLETQQHLRPGTAQGAALVRGRASLRDSPFPETLAETACNDARAYRGQPTWLSIASYPTAAR